MKGQELWCCICAGLESHELPSPEKMRRLTIINGNLICQEHGAFAGPNGPMAAWVNAELARGRNPKGTGPA